MDFGNQNMKTESESESEDKEMGSHESFDMDLINKYKINELEEQIRVMKSENQHLLWHCMIYRKALQEIEGGSEALGKTLHDFEENSERFHSCTCCEYEDLNKTLSQIQEETQQSSNSNKNDKNEKRCPCCATDELMLEISSIQEIS